MYIYIHVYIYMTSILPFTGAAPGEAIVDPEEAAQLNALHDRMLLLCGEHGVPTVQPEAVSMMQRALKAHVRRLLVAGAQFSACAESGEGRGYRLVRIEDLSAALAQPTGPSWLPSCQRIASITRSNLMGGRLL